MQRDRFMNGLKLQAPRRVVARLMMVFLCGLLLLNPLTTPSASADVPVGAARGSSFVAAAVNRVGPAVVRIDTERTVSRNVDPMFNDPFFRQFFGDGMMPPGGRYEERLRGQGSGFIISADGTILTNAHVVDDADRVTVRLKDGRQFDGEVRGVDEVTDLAVVKINTSDRLPVATLGDSDAVQVGDWAIAVGNPLGLDNTVTLGIVSTLNRSSADVGIPDKRLDFIQTDAAINPGNSGGPLLNEKGEVIGINTAIRANAMGIGFAIPINKAKDISTRLARGESVQHPYLGVQIATLTPEQARDNNEDPNATLILPEVNGALVMGIVPDSPAAKGGIRRGDVITQVNGQAITRADQLQTIVENSELGKPLQITVKRGDLTRTLSVRTAELQPAGKSSSALR
ncbi:HhoA/HhoB/HtrA family serine endopeptidase [Thermoleptolyngbya sp. C42_A2020_037]|uniref:HhoA/HhoB/HtrA family serine endopeptidase n=1 Tax=Thermoleptolyngbya sp. C42_A2020_037 TaxID=2747799 RepID=UPI001A0BD811|nr:HhoA/HhoB/HtrA family serine endopeptidase [Thermoleptolyngbya sp. C42_A2020_037]MBF2083932.1 trypsin-like peptidase domain-containing protein [Thermoleptolyngbya sp. C42_A2020_037]